MIVLKIIAEVALAIIIPSVLLLKFFSSSFGEAILYSIIDHPRITIFVCFILLVAMCVAEELQVIKL